MIEIGMVEAAAGLVVSALGGGGMTALVRARGDRLTAIIDDLMVRQRELEERERERDAQVGQMREHLSTLNSKIAQLEAQLLIEGARVAEIERDRDRYMRSRNRLYRELLRLRAEMTGPQPELDVLLAEVSEASPAASPQDVGPTSWDEDTLTAMRDAVLAEGADDT